MLVSNLYIIFVNFINYIYQNIFDMDNELYTEYSLYNIKYQYDIFIILKLYYIYFMNYYLLILKKKCISVKLYYI